MGLSFGHIALVAVLLVLFFGRGRVPQLMGDVAAGIKSFRREMREEDGVTDVHDASKRLDT